MTAEITQADREAAAAVGSLVGRYVAVENARIRLGELDTDPLVIAFARHRIVAEAAARPVVERDLWHPIETAPKDGTTIDAWRDGTRETVYWGFPPHECGEMGSYCDSDWHGLKKPGWICSTFGEIVGGEHDPFTHWMPLPDGPEESLEPIQWMLAQEEGEEGSFNVNREAAK